MDRSFVARNGTPTAWTSKLNALTNVVHIKYQMQFGIDLDFHFTVDANHLVMSEADSCLGSTNYTSSCTHTTSENCSNSGPYHHNNGVFVRDSIQTVSKLVSASMILTSHKICIVTSNGHGTAGGIASMSSSRVIVSEHDVAAAEGETPTYKARSTVAHEIGHLFGVKDHYNTQYGDTRDDCIWGRNYNEKSVVNSLKMCSVCQATIESNKSKYNQS